MIRTIVLLACCLSAWAVPSDFADLVPIFSTGTAPLPYDLVNQYVETNRAFGPDGPRIAAVFSYENQNASSLRLAVERLGFHGLVAEDREVFPDLGDEYLSRRDNIKTYCLHQKPLHTVPFYKKYSAQICGAVTGAFFGGATAYGGVVVTNWRCVDATNGIQVQCSALYSGAIGAVGGGGAGAFNPFCNNWLSPQEDKCPQGGGTLDETKGHEKILKSEYSQKGFSCKKEQLDHKHCKTIRVHTHG